MFNSYDFKNLKLYKVVMHLINKYFVQLNLQIPKNYILLTI